MTGAPEASPAVGSASRLPALPRFVRTEEDRVAAGVCSGIAAALGADPSLVRLVFAILAFAGGSGVVLYLGLWLLLPPPDAREPRGGAARAVGVALAALAGLLAMRGLGLADSLLIPGALIALGVLAVSRGAATRKRSRLVLGFLLIVGGTIVYVNEAGPLGGESAIVAPGAVAIALIAVVAPWLWRLARERDAERLERIRSQERAEVAARVHDSVLQTLALIQRRADDPREVGALARQQERELRRWLYGRALGGGATVASALERTAAEVEELHGVKIDVVSAGDSPLDARLDALVLAAREAMTNAAKFSGADAISVYVEAQEGGATVFVRDRGVGFDRAAVPLDRHGIRESIERRLARHGGAATIVTAPGSGTEVELSMPAAAR
ncbi:MAG: PspC domain-containing protein [Thermoleophilia bacterium]|nr:PspC domain-containing protein [Thermoleophilia bacterium]